MARVVLRLGDLRAETERLLEELLAEAEEAHETLYNALRDCVVKRIGSATR